MIAIVLTAGCGRRMRPLTDTTHKTLIEIGGRTVIDRLLDALVANGIRRVVVVTGYRAEDLRGHLARRNDQFEFTYVHNARWADTNNIVSVALALEHTQIDDDVLLVESDLVMEPAVIGRILQSPYPDVALVDRFRPGMDGTVVSLDGDLVSAVTPPHLQGPGFRLDDKYKTVNIYKLSRHFCDGAFRRLITWYAHSLDDQCYYEVILGILITGRQVQMHAAVLGRERWCEVDDPVDLDQVRFVFDPSNRDAMLTRSMGGLWLHEVLDFCWLRNAHFPTASAWEELRHALPSVLVSYGSAQAIIDRKMSWWLQCAEERVVALNGASTAFPLLAGLLRGETMLGPEPTFGEYSRWFPQARTYRDAPGYDLEALPSLVPPGGCVAVVTPNNPTGTHVGAERIHQLAKAWPDRRFLVDTSFAAFANDVSTVALLETDPLQNVVVLESLSKSLGTPGLRLGWLYSANLDLVQSIRAGLPIWAMNSMAEHFLEMLLKRRDEVAASFAHSATDRDHLATTLAGLPGVADVILGHGNFLLVRLDGGPEQAAGLTSALLCEHAISIKNASAKMGDGRAWIRVAVRTPADHVRLARAWQASSARVPEASRAPLT